MVSRTLGSQGTTAICCTDVICLMEQLTTDRSRGITLQLPPAFKIGRFSRGNPQKHCCSDSRLLFSSIENPSVAFSCVQWSPQCCLFQEPPHSVIHVTSCPRDPHCRCPSLLSLSGPGRSVATCPHQPTQINETDGQ